MKKIFFSKIIIFLLILTSLFGYFSIENRAYAFCQCTPNGCSADCNCPGKQCFGHDSVCTNCPPPTPTECFCTGTTCSQGCVEAIAGKPCSNDQDCIIFTDPNCTLCSALDFFFDVILTWIFGIGVVLAIIFMIIGAIRYIIAGDDPKKITDAKGTVTWAVIGLVILITAAGLIGMIWYFLGLPADKLFFIPIDSDSGIIDCSMCR